MVLKLCTRALQRGIDSMDYVDALLIMEDSVEDSDTEVENSEDTENRQCNDEDRKSVV